MDGSGNLFVADQSNDVIRVITPQSIISTIAGTGGTGFSGDGGPAIKGILWTPYSVAVDSAGNVYVTDTANAAIRLVTPVGNRAVLTTTVTHTDSFIFGEIASYQVTVSNVASAGPTIGTVTVTPALPPGLTLVSMSGDGWSCAGNTCSRSDVLAGGASYPPIIVAFVVGSGATDSSPPR